MQATRRVRSSKPSSVRGVAGVVDQNIDDDSFRCNINFWLLEEIVRSNIKDDSRPVRRNPRKMGCARLPSGHGVSAEAGGAVSGLRGSGAYGTCENCGQFPSGVRPNQLRRRLAGTNRGVRARAAQKTNQALYLSERKRRAVQHQSAAIVITGSILANVSAARWHFTKCPSASH